MMVRQIGVFTMRLGKEDITDNIIIIKINRSYKPDMSDLQLYDVTRGCWKISIPMPVGQTMPLQFLMVW
jgi:hypothetical protein